VYVANLPWGATEDQLAACFSELGPVVAVRVIQDPRTGRSRGYGFVELSAPESARLAVSRMNGRDFNGRKLLVSYARPRSSRDDIR
jgi:RNA recognition motif-containing protein